MSPATRREARRRPLALSNDRLAFILAVVAHLALLYWPRAQTPGALPHLDKIAHAAAFAAVAWTGLRMAWPRRWLVAALVVHAVVSEIVQHLVLPGRSGDPADVLADVIGVAVGLLGGTWTHEGARAHERPRARGRRDGRPPGGAAAGRHAGPR